MQLFSPCRSMRLLKTAVLILTLGFVLPSFATEIDGLFSYDNNLGQFSPAEVIYKIHIENFQQFSAQTVPVTFNTMGYGAVPDTSLFLFDSSWNGIYANDDISVSDTLSLLPNPFGAVGPSSNGYYYLAIAFGLDSALDGMGNAIFSGGFTDVTGPNPGVGPLASWQGGSAPPYSDLRAYQIELAGVPEPTSLALLAPGLVMAWTSRKRFRSHS